MTGQHRRPRGMPAAPVRSEAGQPADSRPLGEFHDDTPRAEFECGCYARLTPEWTLSLWQCAPGCPNWALILEQLEGCVRGLAVQALGRDILGIGGGPGGGESL